MWIYFTNYCKEVFSDTYEWNFEKLLSVGVLMILFNFVRQSDAAVIVYIVITDLDDNHSL